MAAMINQIPIAHIHGGESTEGLLMKYKTPITKMSHLHFVSTNKYFKGFYSGEKKENILMLAP